MGGNGELVGVGGEGSEEGKEGRALAAPNVSLERLRLRMRLHPPAGQHVSPERLRVAVASARGPKCVPRAVAVVVARGPKYVPRAVAIAVAPAGA